MALPKRYRYWTTILYPESCVENWRSLLDDEHIQYLVSPLHEFDTNPDGELKKPHWHLVFVFDGVKSYEQILSLCTLCGAVSPQYCLSLRGITRYLAHLDNPEKHRYNVEDIECHGGIDIDECLKKTKAESHKVIMNVLHYIDEKNILEYWDLLMMCEIEHPDWLDLLLEGYTIVITSAINSRRNIVYSRRNVDT